MITGARYAALGVLDEQRSELERFVTAGIDAATHRAIGDLPRGRGVLGVLIEDPRPLRLGDVGRHPRSYGFPAGHPADGSFLGVPIMIRGQAWGNLYLTEKDGGASSPRPTRRRRVILAQWAATAIENARLYEISERRREEPSGRCAGCEAPRHRRRDRQRDELGRVLELIVKRGRALVDARSVLIMLREGDELVVAASAGHAADVRGRRLPISGSTSGQVLERGRPERIATSPADLRIARDELGVPDAHTALLVPMIHRGDGVGVLAAFDRGEDGAAFTDERRAAAADVRRLGGQRGGDRAQRRGGPAAQRDGGRRRRARGGGRASCTTRRCRRSAGCACCLPAALRRADPDAAPSRRSARRSRRSSRRSRTCARSSPTCAPRCSTSSA